MSMIPPTCMILLILDVGSLDSCHRRYSLFHFSKKGVVYIQDKHFLSLYIVGSKNNKFVR